MVKWTFGAFFKQQFAPLKPVLHANLKGKSVIIVGANTGIGLETARHFARMNPSRVILACRNEQKGTRAVEDIKQTTGFAPELRLVDLADFSSVTDFAAKLQNEPIDILVANAGVAQMNYNATKDGWEEILQVNHLSTALLSFFLLPNMRRAAAEHNSTSRLVVVSSEMHHLVKFDDKLLSPPGLLHRLNNKEQCTPGVMKRRYHDTKLLNILFARAFAQHLGSSGGVIATSVNPGFCVSELHRHFSPIERLANKLVEWTVARTAEQGARQVVWAAVGPDGQEGPHVRDLNGAYVSGDGVAECSDYAISKEGQDAQKKIWAETVDILSDVAPSIRDILGQKA